MKQPRSCQAGEGQGLRTVTPCVLFIPASDDTWLQPCNVRTACRLNTSRPILLPLEFPILAQQGAARLPDWGSKGTAVSGHNVGAVAQPRAAWGQVLARSCYPDGLVGCGSQGCGCCQPPAMGSCISVNLWVVIVWLYWLSHGTMGILELLEMDIPGLSSSISH